MPNKYLTSSTKVYFEDFLSPVREVSDLFKRPLGNTGFSDDGVMVYGVIQYSTALPV